MLLGRRGLVRRGLLLRRSLLVRRGRLLGYSHRKEAGTVSLRPQKGRGRAGNALVVGFLVVVGFGAGLVVAYLAAEIVACLTHWLELAGFCPAGVGLTPWCQVEVWPFLSLYSPGGIATLSAAQVSKPEP